MTCDEIRHWLDAYVDNELDAARAEEIEQHIGTCAECGRVYRQHQKLHQALGKGDLYYRAPDELRNRILATMPQSAVTAPVRRMPWRPFALAASLLLTIAVGWSLATLTRGSATTLADAAISAHIRAMMSDGAHLMDVISTDQHTVKPWLARNIDFSPPVGDYKEQGFPLKGARLDYLDNRQVASLVYGRHLHIIDLFVWPAPDQSDHQSPATTERGFHTIMWTQNHMQFIAVSDVNETELGQFVQLVQQPH